MLMMTAFRQSAQHSQAGDKLGVSMTEVIWRVVILAQLHRFPLVLMSFILWFISLISCECCSVIWHSYPASLSGTAWKDTFSKSCCERAHSMAGGLTNWTRRGWGRVWDSPDRLHLGSERSVGRSLHLPHWMAKCSKASGSYLPQCRGNERGKAPVRK